MGSQFGFLRVIVTLLVEVFEFPVLSHQRYSHHVDHEQLDLGLDPTADENRRHPLELEFNPNLLIIFRQI